jgi:hypothetical protein
MSPPGGLFENVKQEHQHMAKKPVNKLDHVNAAIKRWQSRLQRAMKMLAKLEKQRKRIEKPRPRVYAEIVDVTFRPRAHAAIGDPMTLGPAIQEAIKDQGITGAGSAIDTSIPAFLQRKSDSVVAEQIKADQEETKRKKARGKAETRKAKKAGDLKRMPLTGKAALEHIRNG